MAGQLDTRTLGHSVIMGCFREGGKSRSTCRKDPKFTLIFTSSSPCLRVHQAQSPTPELFSPTPGLFSPTQGCFPQTQSCFPQTQSCSLLLPICLPPGVGETFLLLSKPGGQPLNIDPISRLADAKAIKWSP